MKTLKDLLIFYNNSDTYPFLKALNRQASLYREYDLDMLKDAPSLPGLSLKIWNERPQRSIPHV